MPIEDELMKEAQEADDLRDQAFSQAAPEGVWSVQALNAVVAELNQLLPSFGAEPYPPFDAPPAELPSEFVRLLTMVAQAATDAKLGQLAPDLKGMVDDTGAMLVAGQLSELSQSREFALFLESAPPEPEGEEAPPTSSPVGENEAPAPPAEQTDAMFASRL